MNAPGTLWSRRLDLKGICDVCGRPRSSGNNTLKHTKCSRIRQAAMAQKVVG